MTALKVEKMGDMLAVALPKDVAEKLSLTEGSDLLLIAAGDGELRLFTRAAETARQVEIGLGVMDRFSGTFAALAK